MLPGGRLGVLAAKFALGADCRHAFGDVYPRQAGLELSEGGQDVEGHLAHRAGQVHAAGAVLNEEQHVQAPEEHGVDVEEIDSEDRLGLDFQECQPGLSERQGAGSIPAS